MNSALIRRLGTAKGLGFVVGLIAFLATLPEGLNSLQSPFWFVVEGMVLGLLIDWVATKVGGEGREVLTG